MEIKDYIVHEVQDILNTEFTGAKTYLKIHNGRLQFACPYCGDSSSDTHKKRGNVFFNSMKFHCYNSGCLKHTTVVSFLQDFNKSFSSKDDLIEVLDIIAKGNISRDREYFTPETITLLDEYSIKRDDFKNKFNLVEVTHYKISSYIKKRLLNHVSNRFLYSVDTNRLYILHLHNGKIIGYQIRNFNKSKSKYESYHINRLNIEMGRNLEDELESNIIANMNFISLIFNIFAVDYTKPITVFEGPIDSFLYRNAIGFAGIEKNVKEIDDLENIRYLFDNDYTGIQKLEEKLRLRKNVFMWKKFLEDFNIKSAIKDLNDLLIYCKQNKNEAWKHIDKYFTNDPLDIRSI